VIDDIEQKEGHAKLEQLLSQQADVERVRAAELAAESKRLEQEKESTRIANEEKKQRAKEERQAKLAAKKKQVEEEMKAMEAEKLRRLEAKKEKQAVLDQQKDNQMVEAPAQPTQPKAKKKSTIVSIGVSSSISSSITYSSGSKSNNNKRNTLSTASAIVSKPPPNRKKKEFVLESTRLSNYIKARPNTSGDDESPIFALLQNGKTEQAHKLLKLECEARSKISAVEKASGKQKQDQKVLEKIIEEEKEFEHGKDQHKKKGVLIAAEKSWKEKSKMLMKKKKELLEQKMKIETREYLSQQEIDKKDEYEAKKKTRAGARVKLINTIEQLEKDTSTNGIVQLKNLKVASSKLNAVQLMISNLQQDNPTDVKTRSRLEKDAAMYEQKLYDELLKLDLNTDGKDWEFGGDIDKVALEFVTQHKRLGSVRHRINKIKEDATLSNAH